MENTSQITQQRRSSRRHGSEIEFRHLRYSVTAREHGSLRKAGMAFSIQQSTVSRAIRDLEDRLGASLFQRHIGGVRLTIAGERFPHRTRIALQQIMSGVSANETIRA